MCKYARMYGKSFVSTLALDKCRCTANNRSGQQCKISPPIYIYVYTWGGISFPKKGNSIFRVCQEYDAAGRVLKFSLWCSKFQRYNAGGGYELADENIHCGGNSKILIAMPMNRAICFDLNWDLNSVYHDKEIPTTLLMCIINSWVCPIRSGSPD